MKLNKMTAVLLAATMLGGVATPALAASKKSSDSELRAIVARATAHDPQHRYGSVQELDADLGRCLAARPVSAVGSSLGYTLRCAIRRHPLIAAASAATTLAIVVLVAGFSWRLAQERDLARAQAERASREASNAAAVARFLEDDLLALADPNTSQDVDLKVQTLLERARDAVDQRLAGQPEIAAQIHTTLARSLRGLGDFEAASAEFALAESKSIALAADDPWRLQLDLWRGDLDLGVAGHRHSARRLCAQHDRDLCGRKLRYHPKEYRWRRIVDPPDLDCDGHPVRGLGQRSK